MSGTFQLESEASLLVNLVYVHPTTGSIISHHYEDLSPFCKVLQLKQNMAEGLGVPAEEQVWKYKGEELDDSQTLDDVEMESDDTIEVTRSST